MRLSILLTPLLLTGLLLGGCSSTPDVLPESKYYNQARSALNGGNFSEATENLENLETYYPFGRYAEQVQLDIIYAKFQGLDLEGAQAAADRFLRLRPQSTYADYALYMRGVAAFAQDRGLAATYFPMDMGARDPGEMRKSYNDFNELISRYPQSEYSPDAIKRIHELRNRLAELEVYTARYYIRREAFVAAANRARYVVENYSQTQSTEAALTILVECYRELGMKSEADDALAILAVNYPNGESFDADMHFKPRYLTVRESRSLKSVLTFGLFQ